jgi:hypothetical protein
MNPKPTLFILFYGDKQVNKFFKDPTHSPFLCFIPQEIANMMSSPTKGVNRLMPLDQNDFDTNALNQSLLNQNILDQIIASFKEEKKSRVFLLVPYDLFSSEIYGQIEIQKLMAGTTFSVETGTFDQKRIGSPYFLTFRNSNGKKKVDFTLFLSNDTTIAFHSVVKNIMTEFTKQYFRN